MKKIRFIAVTLLVATIAALSSCTKETSRGNAFEAEFELLTPSFFNGEEFQFQIKSNRQRIKVIAFDFRLAPKMVEVNDTYSLSDGIWAPKIKVNVPETQRGRLTIKIQDITTGATREFSANYTAYQSSGIVLTIDNSPLDKKTKIGSDHPLIVDGDDFQFTLRSASQELILTDFKCEFNDGTLRLDQEYYFDERGRKSFSIPSVCILEDEIAEPQEFSMTFNNPETGRDTTVRTFYYKAIAFRPTVVLEPSELRNGTTATVKIGGNRESFQLNEFSHPDWFELKGVSKDYECKPGINGYVPISSNTLSVTSDSSGEMTFFFTDNLYTMRQMQVTVPYTAISAKAPESVILDHDFDRLTAGTTAVFKVNTEDSYSDRRFKASLLSGESGSLMFYAPKSDSETPEKIKDSAFSQELEFTEGRLFVRAFGTGGESAFRVCSAGKPSVYKDADIFVKYDVALVIQGYFENWMENHSGRNLASDFSENQSVGWYGFSTRNFTAGLMRYKTSNGTDPLYMSKEDAKNKLILTSISEQTSSPLVVGARFVLVDVNESGTGYVSGGSFFYKNYYNSDHVCLNGTKDPRYWLHEKRLIRNGVVPLVQETEDKGYGVFIECPTMTEATKIPNCDVLFAISSGGSREEYDSKKWFSSASLQVTRLTYDKEKFNVNYIIYKYKLSDGSHGPAEPWWGKFDQTDTWIEECSF